MNRPIVVLSISGGMLQDVFCSDSGSSVILVDWDTEGRTAEEPHVVEVSDSLGRAALAYVAEYPVAPLAHLAGDVASALAASDVHRDHQLANALLPTISAGTHAEPAPHIERPPAIHLKVDMPSPQVMLLTRLVAWYDDATDDDGELERIVMAARYETRRSK